jgi:hypothetical protein
LPVPTLRLIEKERAFSFLAARREAPPGLERVAESRETFGKKGEKEAAN